MMDPDRSRSKLLEKYKETAKRVLWCLEKGCVSDAIRLELEGRKNFSLLIQGSGQCQLRETSADPSGRSEEVGIAG